jgi:hypothetical protein
MNPCFKKPFPFVPPRVISITCFLPLFLELLAVILLQVGKKKGNLGQNDKSVTGNSFKNYHGRGFA